MLKGHGRRHGPSGWRQARVHRMDTPRATTKPKILKSCTLPLTASKSSTTSSRARPHRRYARRLSPRTRLTPHSNKYSPSPSLSLFYLPAPKPCHVSVCHEREETKRNRPPSENRRQCARAEDAAHLGRMKQWSAMLKAELTGCASHVQACLACRRLSTQKDLAALRSQRFDTPSSIIFIRSYAVDLNQRALKNRASLRERAGFPSRSIRGRSGDALWWLDQATKPQEIAGPRRPSTFYFSSEVEPWRCGSSE